jgi:hypothetical protein
MGYGTGKKDTPGVHGLQKAGKMHGGGVNLSPKKENTGGGMDLNQKKMMAGDYSPNKSGIISGGHSKGKFMSSPKYKSHGTSKANYDKDMAEERIQIKDDKQKIYQDDKEKRDSSPKKMLSKKQSKVIDGADGSKKNDKIEGSEMAALSKK